MTSREPYQIGAELFGHAGIEADREILELLLASLAVTKLTDVRVSLGHVGLFRILAAAAGVNGEIGHPLFRALRAKDMPELLDLTKGLAEPWRSAFLRLPELYGGPDVIEMARRALPDLPDVRQALDDLADLLSAGATTNLSVDLPTCAAMLPHRCRVRRLCRGPALRRGSGRALRWRGRGVRAQPSGHRVQSGPCVVS